MFIGLASLQKNRITITDGRIILGGRGGETQAYEEGGLRF